MAKTLEFRGIGKSYPGVRALDNVNFKVESGKVLALLGENGAGKSTLLKILSGDQKPTDGEILVDGKPTVFNSPHDAHAAGISVIYQERQLMPSMSVAENIFAGAIPVKGKGPMVDWKKLYEETKKLIDFFGLDIDPSEQVGRLSIANQQMVEIMKAYRRNSDIIAYDEPTAPLSEKEIELMFQGIEKQKQRGMAIIYVSHRMNEIFRITDEIVILKDGKHVATMETAKTTEAELITKMVGRDIGDTYSNLRRNTPKEEVVLEVKNLNTPKLHNVSFQVHAGEIVGLAGLVGAGRTETARAIFAADPITSGEIWLGGKQTHFKSPRDAIDAGVALCPEGAAGRGIPQEGPLRGSRRCRRSVGQGRFGLRHQDAHDHEARGGALRRQSAEGHPRSLDERRGQDQAADPGRAHQGHRRRHQGRDLSEGLRSGQRGHRGALHLQ